MKYFQPQLLKSLAGIKNGMHDYTDRGLNLNNYKSIEIHIYNHQVDS